MTWLEFKNSYIKNYYDHMLAHPEIQMDSLVNIEEVLTDHYPEIIQDPLLMKRYSEEEFIKMIQKKKPSAKITAIDRSVISGLYKLLK